MENEPRRNRLGNPIVLTGEDADNLIRELENPTEPTEEQKQFFREVLAYAEVEEIKETFEQALAYIEDGSFSDEQRTKLMKALENKK